MKIGSSEYYYIMCLFMKIKMSTIKYKAIKQLKFLIIF